MSYLLGTSGQTSYVQCDNIDCWVFKRGYKQNFSYMYENNLRIPFLKIKYTETFQDFCYYIGILDFLRVGQYWQSTFFVIDIFENINFYNPSRGGGGSKCSIGQEIGSHFSQDHPMVTKILDFIHKHPN